METENDSEGMKAEIISEIKRVANLLNTNKIARVQFKQNSKISEHQILMNFGSWNNALKEAGLEVTDVSKIDDQTLFEELDRVVKKLQKIPTGIEMERTAKFGLKTYTKRFGGWPQTIEKYK